MKHASSIALSVVVVLLAGTEAASAKSPSRKELARRLDALEQSAVPAGTVVAYLGVVPPEGWLLCNGLDAVPEKSPLRDVLSAAGLDPDVAPDLRGQYLRGQRAGEAGLGRKRPGTVGEVQVSHVSKFHTRVRDGLIDKPTTIPERGWSDWLQLGPNPFGQNHVSMRLHGAKQTVNKGQKSEPDHVPVSFIIKL